MREIMKMADVYVSIRVRGTTAAHHEDGSRSLLLSDDGVECAHVHFVTVDQAKRFADAINAAAADVGVAASEAAE